MPDPRNKSGGVAGIHDLQHGDMREGGGWVYIMTNRPNGTLYLAVILVRIAGRRRQAGYSKGRRSRLLLGSGGCTRRER